MNPLQKYKQDTGKTWQVIGDELGISKQRAHQLGQILPHQVPGISVRVATESQKLGIDWISWEDETFKK